MNRAPDELGDEQDDPVTATPNELADRPEPAAVGTAGRRLIEAGLWTW